MATVKIKFRSSTVSGKKGSVYYQVIHRRLSRQIKTVYRLTDADWQQLAQTFDITSGYELAAHLIPIRDNIEEDMRQLRELIRAFRLRDVPFHADDVVSEYLAPKDPEISFFSFVRLVIRQMSVLGKLRMCETYTSTFNSFCRFRRGIDLSPQCIDHDLLCAYELYLRGEGICKNSSSFYMRNLRSLYNRAVERGLTPQRNPFKHVYTGVDKTVKRAVPLSVIRHLKSLALSDVSGLDFARDMFLFSFYTRGMAFVDMAYLRKADLQGGVLTYRRKKTGQKLSIRWEVCMQEIVAKYDTRNSPYLLPIIRSADNDRRQYLSASHLVNAKLKCIGVRLHLPIPLTMYVARHGWASIARSKNIPLSVISEGMGHGSETTTRIYLASLDTATVDKANRLILESL